MNKLVLAIFCALVAVTIQAHDNTTIVCGSPEHLAKFELLAELMEQGLSENEQAYYKQKVKRLAYGLTTLLLRGSSSR